MTLISLSFLSHEKYPFCRGHRQQPAIQPGWSSTATPATADLLPPAPATTDNVASAGLGLSLVETSIDCPAPAEGESVGCLNQGAARVAKDVTTGDSAARAIVPLPDRCKTPEAATRGVRTRTTACGLSNLTYTTYTTVNGVTSVTGALQMNVFSYLYTSNVDPKWSYQIQVSAYAGYGVALEARIRGTGSTSGSCRNLTSSFVEQTVLPFNTTKSGEAAFETTATAPGAVGKCPGQWILTLSTSKTAPSSVTYIVDEVRCDNATGGSPRRIGCVVPAFSPTLNYSRSTNPGLSSHISKAQTSGLPGAVGSNSPLVRITDQATIRGNRNLACGNAPILAGLSCDEYPLASTGQGLAAGGTSRTFDGCQLDRPRATGTVGVSVCMVAATEQNSQGGLTSKFYQSQRVLDGDSFYVGLTS